MVGVTAAGILLLLPRLISFWDVTSALVRWPWQFDFDEGHNLNATVLLAHGTNIYSQNGLDSFISAPYTPLFYGVNVPFTWLFGPTFGPGRLLSALSTVAIGVLLACIARMITSRWSPGLLAGALWLSLSPVIVWAGFYKQDMPALALQMVGLAWVLRYSDSNRRYSAVIFFALAFFTKQSAVAAAAATSLWLLVRDWRTGLRFVGLLAACILLPFLVADLLLDGGLSLHVLGYQWKPWNLAYVWHLLSRLWGEYWPMIVAAAGVLGCASAFVILRTRQGSSTATPGAYLQGLAGPWGLIGLYTLAAAGWTCIASGIKGGNYNLLLDGLPPVVLLAPSAACWLLYRLPGLRGRARVWAAGGALMLAGLFVVQVVLFADPYSWYHGGWPGEQQDQSMQGISNLIAQTPGDLYSEDDYLILHSGRPVIYDDPSTFPLLAQAGRWDDSGFKQALRDRRFALVILWPGSGRFTSDERAVFDQDYTLAYADVLDTYAPKIVPDAPEYSLACRMMLGTDTVRLNGYSLAPGVAGHGVRPGDVLRVSVYWAANAGLHGSYASFAHVVDENGKMLAGRDEPATGSGKPTTAWPPGHIVTDDLAIPIPKNATPGRYRVVIGMYANNGGSLIPLVSTCSDVEQKYGDAVATNWINIAQP